MFRSAVRSDLAPVMVHYRHLRERRSWPVELPSTTLFNVLVPTETSLVCKLSDHAPEAAGRQHAAAHVNTTRRPTAQMISPVTQADSSDVRNTASGAISVIRPSRPTGRNRRDAQKRANEERSNRKAELIDVMKRAPSATQMLFRGQVDDPATSRRIFPPRCACATASWMDERG
jgi:hypothetical protein